MTQANKNEQPNNTVPVEDQGVIELVTNDGQRITMTIADFERLLTEASARVN